MVLLFLILLCNVIFEGVSTKEHYNRHFPPSNGGDSRYQKDRYSSNGHPNINHKRVPPPIAGRDTVPGPRHPEPGHPAPGLRSKLHTFRRPPPLPLPIQQGGAYKDNHDRYANKAENERIGKNRRPRGHFKEPRDKYFRPNKVDSRYRVGYTDGTRDGEDRRDPIPDQELAKGRPHGRRPNDNQRVRQIARLPPPRGDPRQVSERPKEPRFSKNDLGSNPPFRKGNYPEDRGKHANFGFQERNGHLPREKHFNRNSHPSNRDQVRAPKLFQKHAGRNEFRRNENRDIPNLVAGEKRHPHIEHRRYRPAHGNTNIDIEENERPTHPHRERRYGNTPDKKDRPLERPDRDYEHRFAPHRLERIQNVRSPSKSYSSRREKFDPEIPRDFESRGRKRDFDSRQRHLNKRDHVRLFHLVDRKRDIDGVDDEQPYRRSLRDRRNKYRNENGDDYRNRGPETRDRYNSDKPRQGEVHRDRRDYPDPNEQLLGRPENPKSGPGIRHGGVDGRNRSGYEDGRRYGDADRYGDRGEQRYTPCASKYDARENRREYTDDIDRRQHEKRDPRRSAPYDDNTPKNLVRSNE